MSERSSHNGRESLVAAAAGCLRLVQTELTDQPPEVRRKRLAGQIDSFLAVLSAEEGAAFLVELREQFPVLDTAGGGAAPLPPQQYPTDDPEFLVHRLSELLPAIPQERRQAMAACLIDAGLVLGTGTNWPQESADALLKLLQAGEKDRIDAGRALELLGRLVDALIQLDDLAWGTWRTLAPAGASTINHNIALRKTLSRFLVGNSVVASEQVEEDVARVGQLVAAIIHASREAGRQFASEHVARFSPAAIEDRVRLEKVGLLDRIQPGSHKVRCWEKYKQLAVGWDAAVIEGEIRKIIAKYAEALIRGPAR